MTRRILLVEDETNLRRVLRAHLEDRGYAVGEAADGETALRMTQDGIFDAVVTDLVMPRLDGLVMLERMRADGFTAPVIMITAYATIDAAVAAMKAGAFDFLVKPVSDEALADVVKRAIGQVAATEKDLPPSAGPMAPLGHIVGESRPMRDLLEKIPAAAASDAAVLLTGESGTGKTLIARAIHDSGRRRKAPFVAVNSAAIPPGLAESELFGHERGAFTGAVARRPGRFEIASGGTLFLDEIGELDAALQAKLLKVLEEKRFERVGGTDTVEADVRIIAATNRDLDAARKEARFRDDLFYRLNVIPFRIPALRERREDIRPLAERCLRRVAEDLGRPTVTLSPKACAALETHAWPGNVRELENILERSVVFLKGNALDVADLPEELRGAVPADQTGSLKDSRRAAERDRIEAALAAADRNVTRTAQNLGISRRGLQIKMREFGLR